MAANKTPSLPSTPEALEAEASARWAEYRKVCDEGASGPEIEALQKRVSSALSRAKKIDRLSTTTQRLQDLAGYLKRLAPKPTERVTFEELEREAAQIEAEMGRSTAESLLARVRRLLRIIEAERAREADEADEDHDRFVTLEERLWDIQGSLAKGQSGDGSGSGKQAR